LTFASQNTGTASAAQDVVLTNFGEAPLDISNIAASGDFSQTDSCGPTLPGGSNCTIGVTYAPTVTGKETGTVTITDNAFTGTQTVALSGTGTAPVAGIAPASLSFQPQAINATSGPQLVFLSNTGTGALTFSGAGIATSGDFAQTNNCGAALAPQTSCTITVTYTPTITGPETGGLIVTSNAAPQTVTLAGTGAATTPTVTAAPESLIFSPELLKIPRLRRPQHSVPAMPSPPQTVTLTNSGANAVSIASIVISGDFTKAVTCGTSLGAGKSCIENVYFTPTAAGTRTGALTFKLSSGVVTVALTGTGVTTPTALLTASPPSVAFTGYVVGDNPDQIVTISNPDGVPAGIRLITKTGSTAFTFAKTCGTTLAAGASCTVDVTFIPTIVGSYSGILYVYESAGTIHMIPLSGTTAVTGN